MSSRTLVIIILGLPLVALLTAESPCPLGARFERGPATFGCPRDSAPLNGYCCQLLWEAGPVCAGGVTFERGIPVNGSCPAGAMVTFGDTPYSACCQAPEPGSRCPGGARFERGVPDRGCPPDADDVNGFCCTFQPKTSVCPGGGYHELGPAKDGRCPPWFNF
ncbi:hypothetical protein AAVH_29793 [Aphelenchoides avenae]|nr:hypothetical protein AAVH_29793 [Aphelenchus avenae]